MARPDEELVDQGLAFDVGTLLSRRRVLGVLGLGAAGVGLAACAGTPTTAAASSSPRIGVVPIGVGRIGVGRRRRRDPGRDRRPLPGDGSNGPDVLAHSGIVRSDIRSSVGAGSATAQGVPTTRELTVTDLARGGIPCEGVAVYVWHCDRDGGYSMSSSGLSSAGLSSAGLSSAGLSSAGMEREHHLRGVQIADARGKVTFTSVFPACCAGRRRDARRPAAEPLTPSAGSGQKPHSQPGPGRPGTTTGCQTSVPAAFPTSRTTTPCNVWPGAIAW